MNSHNPIVKTTAKETINESINSLGFLISAISLNTSDSENQVRFNAADIAGFCNHLRCIQAALESGYEQAT